MPAEDLDLLPLARVPRQARSREKVEAALAAATDLVRTEGVEALTLPRVAEHAGLSVGAVYQYLPDRDAIIAVLVARYHARFEEVLDGVVERVRRTASAGSPDPLADLLDEVERIYAEEGVARALRAVEGSGPAAERRAHKDRMTAKVADLLVLTGLAPAGRARGVARLVFTAADGVLHEAFGLEDDERTALLRELRAMLRGYLAPAD
ncbi:TetR/AcrR family transcriptional regulator [Nocardioides sp. GY 10127]|uniref:TetR/AcrR family transcriptional regulator n=1 Tax=Nocardioides sp. GY 10127 TaxID=2569762 RepID=UPI0019807E22|nr:TetR/AcrR family transcriptional regulator [Nocardioides sp. GY 10127]